MDRQPACRSITIAPLPPHIRRTFKADCLSSMGPKVPPPARGPKNKSPARIRYADRSLPEGVLIGVRPRGGAGGGSGALRAEQSWKCEPKPYAKVRVPGECRTPGYADARISRTPTTGLPASELRAGSPSGPALAPQANKKAPPYEGASSSFRILVRYLPFGICETICRFTSMPSTWKWGLTDMVTR
jgi:hypothetical protein